MSDIGQDDTLASCCTADTSDTPNACYTDIPKEGLEVAGILDAAKSGGGGGDVSSIESCVNDRTGESGERKSSCVGKYLGAAAAGGKWVDQRFDPLAPALVGDAHDG